MEESTYHRTEEDDYNRIVDLTRETDELRKDITSLKDELARSEYSLRAANNEIRCSSDALKKEEDKAVSLQAQIEKLLGNIEHERAKTKDAEGRVETLYADLDQSRFAHRSVLTDRDEALADKREVELQLEDLKEQWLESERRIEELQAELEDAEQIANHAADIEQDIARMREHIEEQERTLLIKDERISHLEMQVQKERQINYHNADAVARSKAASPVDDDRHIGAIGESLESELSVIEDADFYEIAWNDYSHITETALTYEPIAPAVEPPWTLHSQEAVSISPVAAHVPQLTLDVHEAGRLEPREPAPVAAFTISVSESTSTEPVATVVPTHALVVREAVSTDPIEPTRAPPSSIHAVEIASFEPKAPAPAPQNTLNEHEIASFAPKAPAPIPKNIFSEQETAYIEPKAPAPAPRNDFNEHEIAHIEPRAPGTPVLTVSVREAGSTIPFARRVATASTLTQTDVPRLTNQLIHHAAVSTAPNVPAKAATAESLTQTNAAVLVTEMISHATVSTTPVEPFEVIESPAVKPEVSKTFAVDISPIEPKVDQRKFTTTITKGTQTVPESPRSSPINEVVSVTTTHEVEPMEQVVAKVEPKRPTASTGVQTVIETPVVVVEEEEAAPPSAISVSASTNKSSSAVEWMLTLLTTLLALYCLYLYMQLNAWRTANDMGFGGGYGNAGYRSGPYGNGRTLFGIIPINMNVGESWVSRQIARHMLSAVSRFESWAGVEYEPLY